MNSVDDDVCFEIGQAPLTLSGLAGLGPPPSSLVLVLAVLKL